MNKSKELRNHHAAMQIKIPGLSLVRLEIELAQKAKEKAAQQSPEPEPKPSKTPGSN